MPNSRVSRVIDTVYTLLAGVVIGWVLYGLWWLHNENIFAAAMIAGFLVVGYHCWTVYSIKQQWLANAAFDMALVEEKIEGVRDELADIHETEKRDIAKLTHRLEEDEQKIDELEAPDYGPYED